MSCRHDAVCSPVVRRLSPTPATTASCMSAVWRGSGGTEDEAPPPQTRRRRHERRARTADHPARPRHCVARTAGVKVCPQPGCPTLTDAGRCPTHRRQADQARGTAAQRGYGHDHATRFRPAVLHRDPICVLCLIAFSTVADHHPLSRRELVDAGEDPNDPRHGRGLCASCHNTETARHQPGGWHDLR